MGKNSMMFYESFHKATKELPPEQYKECMVALLDYAMYDIEPELTGMAYSMFVLMQPIVDKHSSLSERGKKGGRPKKPTESEEEANENQTESQLKSNEKPNESQGKANENPTESQPKADKDKGIGIGIRIEDIGKDKGKGKKEKKGTNVPQEKKFDDPELQEAWDGFEEMRNKIKKPMTERAKKLAIKDLHDLSGGNTQKAIAILNQSTKNDWQGLFELKTPPKARSGTINDPWAEAAEEVERRHGA